jgi:Peptidase family M1 domain
LETDYTLAARFDYFNHFLSVSESIVFTNHSGETLFELILVVEPNRWPGTFHLNSISWKDGAPVADYALTGNRLKIPLAQPIQTGAEASLSLSYEITLPEIPEPSDTVRPMPFGYTARQTNVVDWYPFLPPYRPGMGWVVHNPWHYGEHQVYEAADYQVEVQMEQPVQDLTLAASAPALQEADRYRYTLEGARSFAFSASQGYLVLSGSVGDVLVHSYAFPYDRTGGEAALQYASEALALYSELFGPYPHRMLSIVEADFLDGMEYSGMFFLSRGFYNIYDGTPGGYLTAIAVHETAHQWWYEQVGNDQALEPWLDEALCTYAERLYYEHVQPEFLDFWWAFRVDFYEPVGWVNGSIYDFSGFRPYRDAVYLRSAQFLEELRALAGDEAFFAFLRDYTARYRGQQVTAEDFFSLLGEHTSADLSALRATYFDPEK